MTTGSLYPGCFLAISKPFEPKYYFDAIGKKILNQKKYQPHFSINLKKLWHRKYMFFGNYLGLSIETNHWFFFFEMFPSQLFHCDIPNSKLSNLTPKGVYAFYYYPETKGCGFKWYNKNKLLRHIESEIDYHISIDKAENNEKLSKQIEPDPLFNLEKLGNILLDRLVDLPPPLNAPDQPPILYSFQ